MDDDLHQLTCNKLLVVDADDDHANVAPNVSDVGVFHKVWMIEGSWKGKSGADNADDNNVRASDDDDADDYDADYVDDNYVDADEGNE